MDHRVCEFIPERMKNCNMVCSESLAVTDASKISEWRQLELVILVEGRINWH